jgi:hypothetical protein
MLVINCRPRYNGLLVFGTQGWGELLGADSNLSARNELLAWLGPKQGLPYLYTNKWVPFSHTGYLQLMALCWDEFTLSGVSIAATRQGQFLPEAI